MPRKLKKRKVKVPSLNGAKGHFPQKGDRKVDGVWVAATPVAATPVAATPVAATPVAATPVAATPVAATPVAATPVRAAVVAEPEPEVPAPALRRARAVMTAADRMDWFRKQAGWPQLKRSK